MGVNSLPQTVTRQGRGCDLNPGPSVPEISTLTTRLPSHATHIEWFKCVCVSAGEEQEACEMEEPIKIPFGGQLCMLTEPCVRWRAHWQLAPSGKYG